MFSPTKFTIVLVAFQLCVVTATLQAQNSGSEWEEVQTVGAVDRLYASYLALSRTESPPLSSFHQIDPLTVSFVSKRLGRIQLTIDRVKARSWSSTFAGVLSLEADNTPLLIVQGSALLGDDSTEIPIGGAIFEINGVPTLELFLRTQPTVGNTAVVHLPLIFSAPTGYISAVPLSTLEAISCGVDHQISFSGVNEGLATGSPSTSALKIIQIATDADFEWFGRFGSQSNSKVSSLLAAVSAIYQTDLGLTLDVVRQNVWTTSSQPFTTSDSAALLSAFRLYEQDNNHLGDADLYHLFSGKTFEDNIGGRAHVAVLCNIPSFSYGITRRISDSIDYLITAHEIGHNLSAGHDDATTSIMSSVVGGSTSFSALSKGEIANHIATYGSCLHESSDPDPRVEGPELTLAASRDRTTGKITGSVALSNPSSDSCSTVLSFADNSGFTGAKSKTLTTDSFTTIDLEVNAAKKVRSSASKNVYLRASYRCVNEGNTHSSSVRFNIPKSSSGSYPILSRWLARAKNRVVATPE